MKISRKLAIKILRYLKNHKDFYFPFTVMCKEYTEEDEDFVEIEPAEWKCIMEDEKYQTFELWENLQNLDEVTLRLMSKGFLERITNKDAISRIEETAKQYRQKWDIKLCESTDIVQFGSNEYYGGKAEGFEECLEILCKSKFGILSD